MGNVDRCIICGEYVPEGTWVCSNCSKAIMSNTFIKTEAKKIIKKPGLIGFLSRLFKKKTVKEV